MAIDKNMTMDEVAREIHKNAVDHGWWDGERDIDEIYALIHSEWSEALEEARAGRDDVWFTCNECLLCDKVSREECGRYDPAMVCDYRGAKPEGICVELIDGVIRILDYIGYKVDENVAAGIVEVAYTAVNESRAENSRGKIAGMSVANVVESLHMTTVTAALMKNDDELAEIAALMGAATIAMDWVESRGLDPKQLLIEKHEYNVTRPYKHGKKF